MLGIILEVKKVCWLRKYVRRVDILSFRVCSDRVNALTDWCTEFSLFQLCWVGIFSRVFEHVGHQKIVVRCVFYFGLQRRTPENPPWWKHPHRNLVLLRQTQNRGRKATQASVTWEPRQGLSGTARSKLKYLAGSPYVAKALSGVHIT